MTKAKRPDSAASDELLGTIHAMLADDMKARLVNAKGTDPEKATPLSAAEWSAIAKFLKDAGVNPASLEKTPVGDLIRTLPQFEDDEERPIDHTSH